MCYLRQKILKILVHLACVLGYSRYGEMHGLNSGNKRIIFIHSLYLQDDLSSPPLLPPPPSPPLSSFVLVHMFSTAVLGTESKASYMMGKSSIELYPRPFYNGIYYFFVSFFSFLITFEDGWDVSLVSIESVNKDDTIFSVTLCVELCYDIKSSTGIPPSHNHQFPLSSEGVSLSGLLDDVSVSSLSFTLDIILTSL